jgi:hypothetical protein
MKFDELFLVEVRLGHHTLDGRRNSCRVSPLRLVSMQQRSVGQCAGLKVPY